MHFPPHQSSGTNESTSSYSLNLERAQQKLSCKILLKSVELYLTCEFNFYFCLGNQLVLFNTVFSHEHFKMTDSL